MKERRKPFLVILGTVKTAFPDGQDCKNMSKTDMSSTGGYMTFRIWPNGSAPYVLQASLTWPVYVRIWKVSILLFYERHKQTQFLSYIQIFNCSIFL